MAKQIHQRMEENMYEALAKYAEDNGMSVQDSISQAVAQLLNKQAQAAVGSTGPIINTVGCGIHFH